MISLVWNYEQVCMFNNAISYNLFVIMDKRVNMSVEYDWCSNGVASLIGKSMIIDMCKLFPLVRILSREFQYI